MRRKTNMAKNKDILIEEIRERSNKIWGKYKFDIKKIGEYIKNSELKNQKSQIINISK